MIQPSLTVSAAAIAEVDGGHPLRKVEVFWYPDNRLRIRIPYGAPAVMTAAYLEGKGRDINIKLAKS